MHLCWGAQAALYHRYGIPKKDLGYKLFGLYRTKVMNRKIPLVRGFILAESREAGVFLAMSRNGRRIYVMGHPEYDRQTLGNEYRRDIDKGISIQMPKNYYPDDDADNVPRLVWRAHANTLYTNFINYYCYQLTPYSLGTRVYTYENLR